MKRSIEPIVAAGGALVMVLAVSCALLLVLPSSGALAARRAHSQILAALRPRFTHLRAGGGCLRLPDAGPEAIVVVPRTAYVRRARATLHAAGVDGRVEVRTESRYTVEIQELGAFIEQEAPPLAHKPNVGYGGEGQPIECVRAIIELAPRGEASEAEITWAESEIARRGSDRVTYVYEPIAEPTAATKRLAI